MSPSRYFMSNGTKGYFPHLYQKKVMLLAPADIKNSFSSFQNLPHIKQKLLIVWSQHKRVILQLVPISRIR
ncbi:hypothetical protein OESDEN_13983 [Oesophagostomum dentatum]|uniref:Uncharacterized protein n=1 Tax=Oesophagostomum dentatum TaxID=61180 RepID=A0A0B1SQV0_OESDE|nr:hypothetical protein OESDEN_13983 [Oesophagostomum dentatum]